MPWSAPTPCGMRYAGGALQKLYEGDRPPGYATMKKQGAIILGMGGDASCGAIGTFYEGAMTASYTTDGQRLRSYNRSTASLG